MTSKIENIVKTYKRLASIPTLISAKLLNNGTVVKSIWNQRNLERGKIIKFDRTSLLSSDLQWTSEILPVDCTNECLPSISPSEKYKALIREIDEKDGRKQYLEIWSLGSLTHNIDLTSLDIHGDVYTDVSFGRILWSPDETKLLYIAEKKMPKREPFYNRKQVKKEESREEEPVKGEQYLFKQDWGEQYINKKESVLVYYDLTNDDFKIMQGIPEGLCPMQAVWSPDGSYVVGVALKPYPRKLGLIYCTNRPGAVFTLDFNENYDEISLEGKSVRTPIFTPDGNFLVWLEREAEGPHHACMMLVKRAVSLLNKKGSPTVVVPVVITEKIIVGGRKFYGLFNLGFVKRCWASDRRLLLSTSQQNVINTYVIDIDNGNVTELTYSSGSQILLDVINDFVLVNRRNYLYPDRLALGRLPAKGKETSIAFEEIVTSEKIMYLEDYTYENLNLKYSSTSDAVDSFSAIYIGPKTEDEHKVPLVVWPHGGPHSAFTNNMALEIALFSAFGYGLLLINYRGSIGFGQATIEFLLGKVGNSDVKDCIFATQQALHKFPWLNPKRMALIGGSHGGFLVTHISGQYPDMFKAVVARNPVVDIASLSVTSDIPDWSFVESGASYTQKGPMNNKQLLIMRQASPIEHAHKVKAPTLLQVGSKDLRVPPSQATDYYHRLNANGINVRMNVYDDNHPLGNINNEMDNLINSLLWIDQYVNMDIHCS